MINDILKTLTIEEKASLLSQTVWETKELPDERLQNFLWVDGPSGLRKLDEYFDKDIYNTAPAVCYPSVSTYACSWDRELIYQIGSHLGIEAKSESVDGILGPGVNLKRSPLAGRNFEYYSEDPCLTAQLAAEFIKGLQHQGVGACIKHYAVNNQETRRMTIDVQIDEVTLNELYLRAFEKPIREAHPWMVMTAYNRVNGEYCAESSQLLEILRNRWNYDGTVITDCYAAHDLAKGIIRGLNIQMPGENKERLAERIKQHIQAGDITESDLDDAIGKSIELSEKIANNRRVAVHDKDELHNFARKAAEESMVLLKNDDGILPLSSNTPIAVIGEMAQISRFQGGGSSHVNPWKLEDSLSAVKSLGNVVGYAAGYHNDYSSQELMQEAVELAAKAEKVILFIGLPEIYESEGYDRTTLQIPQSHILLLEEICKANQEVIVVLSNGAPVEMPWLSMVKGLLEAYLPGEAGGTAIARLLYGICNPCGKLAETFPNRLDDTPSYLNFPGGLNEVQYKEGMHIGYRYYDKAADKILFPFGFGMSYTEFLYSDFAISYDREKHVYEIELSLSNVGSMSGKEIIQVYLGEPETNYTRPIKELKNFKKVYICAGETKKVSIQLTESDFEQFNPLTRQWAIYNGKYVVYIGKSSQEIVYTQQIHVDFGINRKFSISQDTCLGDMVTHCHLLGILDEAFKSHPKCKEFLALSQSQDPLKKSMGGLMSLNNLKRHDETLKDDDIQRIIDSINA